MGGSVRGGSRCLPNPPRHLDIHCWLCFLTMSWSPKGRELRAFPRCEENRLLIACALKMIRESAEISGAG